MTEEIIRLTRALEHARENNHPHLADLCKKEIFRRLAAECAKA